jgi:hypothetical protein
MLHSEKFLPDNNHEPQICALTPSQGEGPFFPVVPLKSWPRGSSLYTVERWPTTLPERERLHLTVSIETPSEFRSTRFEVLMWQASREGRYCHPGDAEWSRLWDPEFQGFTHQAVDAGQKLDFYSVIPGIYWDPLDGPRPRHLHLSLISGSSRLLTTQIYFEGDRLNLFETSLQNLSLEDRKRLTPDLRWNPELRAWHAHFTIELARRSGIL